MNIDILSRYFTVCDQSDAVVTYTVFKRKMRQFCGIKKQELCIEALSTFFASLSGRIGFVNHGNKTRNIVNGEMVNTICIRGLKEHGPYDLVNAVQLALDKIPWKVIDDSAVLYSEFKRRVCESANVPLTTPNIREIIMSCLPIQVDIKRKWHPTVKGQNLFVCNFSCTSTPTGQIVMTTESVEKKEETQGESAQQGTQEDTQNVPEIFNNGEKQNELVQSFVERHLVLAPHLRCPLRLCTTALIQFAEQEWQHMKHKDAKNLIQLLPSVWVTQGQIHRKYKGKYVMTKFVLGCDLKQ